MQYAPIALFVYNRADHTRQAVQSLLQNEEAKDSILYIFSDGAKTPEKQDGVDRTRAYIHSITGFKKIHIIEREKNWGLANSLIAGITEITERHGRVIVVEDDLILSPFFLKYMNDALEKYKDEERISAISAFLTPTSVKPEKTFFLHYFDCWGWGTWKRAWDTVITDARFLLKKLRWKKSEFDLGNVGGFYGILYCQKVGLVDSWAIYFYASSFIQHKLVLFPPKTLAIQNGFDGSGIHCGGGSISPLFSNMQLAGEPVSLDDINICQCKAMYNAYHDAYARSQSSQPTKRLFLIFKSFIRRFIGLDYK